MSITSPDKIAEELNRRLRAVPMVESTVEFREVMQKVECADGFRVSIQASRTHYCTPRDNYGPWTRVECGYPTAPMPELAEWIDGSDPNETDTVWGYVPILRIAEVLASHGGIREATT